MAMDRFADGIAIHYILSVLWVMSCFHVMEWMGQSKRRRAYFVQFARWWHREWSLLSPSASCLICVCCGCVCQWRWQYGHWFVTHCC